MSFLPGNHREASLPETLVDQAMLPECPEPIVPQEVQCLLAEVLFQDVLHVRDVLRKRGKVGEEPFRPFPRAYSSSARWVVGSISLILPGRQCLHFRSSGCWSGGGSSRENHLNWSWRSHSFSSGEKSSLGLPSPGGGTICCPTGRPGPLRTEAEEACLPPPPPGEFQELREADCRLSAQLPPLLLSVPWRRHIRTNSSPSVCLDKDSSANVSHRTLGMRSQRRKDVCRAGA